MNVFWFWKHRLRGKFHRPHKHSVLNHHLHAVKEPVRNEPTLYYLAGNAGH